LDITAAHDEDNVKQNIREKDVLEPHVHSSYLDLHSKAKLIIMFLNHLHPLLTRIFQLQTKTDVSLPYTVHEYTCLPFSFFIIAKV
jgi:hypothetical protein